jgi:acyl-CoA synthetase (AMP-forming)/AMP-acid ligase II
MITIAGDAGEQAVDFAPDAFSEAVATALSRLAPGATVGLIADTGAPLLKAWHACLGAGCVPVILQKPTQKLSQLYWSHEINRTVRELGVGALLCQASAYDPGAGVPTTLLDGLPAPERASRAAQGLSIAPGAGLLQLSSGTTGHRKGVAFDFAAVTRHVADYNRTLGLGADDCVVSWLPLYHDMGFIAAFLLSQIVGARLVLVDPIRWVRQPDMLFDLIERHGGSLCLMPNFAFEIMTQRGAPRPLPTMRRWISCSEPTRPATIERFLAATKTPPERFSNCYGMAENIFAVAQSDGLRTTEIDGNRVASCGKPVPGTEVKLVDGELFIRSPCSLRQYLGGAPIVDADGFYPSGDVGVMVDDEIYLVGRRHDVVIHAGQKFLLSDVDQKLDERRRTGRVASFGMIDPTLGTETIVGLIEDPEFWVANRDGEGRRALGRETGVETAQIHYVPPRFITKTSSGKVNRVRTAAHWARNLKERDDLVGATSAHSGERLRQEVRNLLPALDLARPIGSQLDSLGLLNLSLLLSRDDPTFRLDPERSVDSYCAAVAPEAQPESTLAPVIKVVAVCNGGVFSQIMPALLPAISHQYRVPIQITQVVVPPAKLLLSDLIFADYFLSRDDRLPSAEVRREVYQPMLAVQRLFRDATLVLVDDIQEVVAPLPEDRQAYYVLNHDFQPGPGSDTLTVRWARYIHNHHLLACDVVDGSELLPSEANASLARLEDYLGIPMVKVAYTHLCADITANWDVICRAEILPDRPTPTYADPAFHARFLQQLLGPLNRAVERGPLREGVAESFYRKHEQSHWCGQRVNPALLDFILDRYDNILVLGFPASASYMKREVERRGKRIEYRGNVNVDGDHDCVVLAGLWGQRPQTTKPLFVIMHAGWSEPGQVYNVDAAVRAAIPPAGI